MTERFVATTGTVSVDAGASEFTGTGTLFAGHDWAGAQLWIQPPDAAPYRVGSVAEAATRGVYANLGPIPLVSAWNGDAIVDADYELIDSVAIANGATQAAIFARFVAFLEENMGLTGNTADDIDYSLIPNNSLFVDPVTRALYQWRNGVLDAVSVVAAAFTPRGAYDAGTTYDQNDLVQVGNAVFVSNSDDNTGNTPVTSPAPASNTYWTVLFLGTGANYADILISAPGTLGDEEEFFGIEFAETIVFPAGMTGSRFSSGVAATAEAIFTLKKNGTAFATATIAAAGTAGTFTAASATTFTAGDVLTAVAPATADATLANIRGTLRGTMEIGSPVERHGVVEIDFGAFPGASDASVAVTGQGKITTSSLAQAWVDPGDGTDDHSTDEHVMAGLQITAIAIVAGTGFTIRAVSPSGRLTGTFNIGWRWD